MTQYGIGEDYFSWSTIKNHCLIYICVRCRVERQKLRDVTGRLPQKHSLLLWMTWWKHSYPEWLDNNLFSQFCSDAVVVWEVCPSKRSKTFKHSGLSIQDFQASRFFQALKQNWMWVRAGILLEWERQLKNNTRDFSEKRLMFFIWNILFPSVR